MFSHNASYVLRAHTYVCLYMNILFLHPDGDMECFHQMFVPPTESFFTTFFFQNCRIEAHSPFPTKYRDFAAEIPHAPHTSFRE